MKLNLMAYFFIAAVAFTAIFKPKLDPVVDIKAQERAATTVKTELDKAKDDINDFLKNVEINGCFIFSEEQKSDHYWEISRVRVSYPYMLLARDETGVLIAQPEPDKCSYDPAQFVCYDYWLRSIDFKDNWLALHPNPQVVKCPDNLNREYIYKLIKTKYPEFKLGGHLVK